MVLPHFSGRVEKVDDEFEPLDKLEDVCALLDELSVKYEVHRDDEGGFSYLKDDEASIKIPNPYTDRTMFIDFQDEISLFFGAEWHEHYFLCERYYNELCETLFGLLKCELCSAAVFIGEERRWGGSMMSTKTEVAERSAEEIFAGPYPDPGETKEYRKAWSEKGAEVHFLFWDPSYDKIVVIEKECAL